MIYLDNNTAVIKSCSFAASESSCDFTGELIVERIGVAAAERRADVIHEQRNAFFPRSAESESHWCQQTNYKKICAKVVSYTRANKILH
jgi:hypothetical protein